jgi:hypothetical protein
MHRLFAVIKCYNVVAFVINQKIYVESCNAIKGYLKLLAGIQLA